MKKFDVQFILTATGKIRVEAEDERAASRKVTNMTLADVQSLITDQDMEENGVEEVPE